MRTSIGDVTAREIIAELVRRHGTAETCRLIGLPESTDLQKLAEDIDRWVR